MKTPEDHIISGSSSDCCDAPIMEGGLCLECREHCFPALPEDEPEPDYDAPSAKQEQ